MKKSLIVVLSMLFVLGLAVPVVVHAADETPAVAKGDSKITLGGKIRIRGDFMTNTDFNEDLGDNKSIYETAVWLSVNVKVSPNTEGMIEFREAKDSSGDDDATWGSTSGDVKGFYKRGGNVSGYTDARYTQFRQAWIQHKGSGLLGIPAGIKIGHMPMKLGNGLFYSHTKNGEDGFILSADPTKELGLALMYAKLYEGTSTTNDDFNLYSLVFNYKPANDVNLSADLSYLDDQKGTVNSAGTVSSSTATSNKGVHLWNLGLRGNTQVAELGLKADVEIQGGKSKGLADYDPVTAGSQAGDVKFKGYAFLVGADYKLNPVTLGLEYAYGSGDSSSTDNKYKGFVNLLDNTSKYTFIYEYRVPQPVANGTTGSQMGLNNTQYIKVSAAGTITKDLKGKLSIYRLRANKVEGFTYNDKDLGWEITPYIEYQIDKNLKYFVEGGYLFAGDFYKNISTVPSGQDPDNPYEIRHGIMLTF